MKRSLSLRARITLLFVLTVAGVGGILIAVMYAYLKLTPVPFEAVFPGDTAITGAVPVTDDILKVVLSVSLTTLTVLTVFSGAIGWFVAGWVITPLTGIAQSARNVTAGNLDQRTGYTGAADEVGDLANALDTMLDSLAASLASQQRFSANASHELKTPIATIQTVADVALAPQATEEEMRAALSQIRTVNARSSETVSALLDLSRAQTPSVSVFDLADALPATEITAATSVNSSDNSAPITVAGDPVLIRQAVDNLLRNAQAHGTPGSTELSVSTESGFAVIEVSNAGPQFAAEELNQLKEPFARGSNRVSGPGHGLGLALVNAIATSHHGHLDLVPRPGGGVIARLRIPRGLPVSPRKSPRHLSD